MRSRLIYLAVMVAFVISGCGGDEGGAEIDVMQEVTEDQIQVDAIPEAEIFIPDLPEEAEATAPECTPENYEAVCPSVLQPGPDQCHEYYCDLTKDGGRCAIRAKKDGSDCDDGQICTSGDACQQGVCVPGPSVCECTKEDDEACAPKPGDNLCLGTKKCDLTHFPYKCVIDPATVPAPCGKELDTFCKVNKCDPVDGKCKMTPVHEGEECDDNNICTLKTVCQDGECMPTPDGLRDCDDKNPCTDDTCEHPLGCVHVPNSEPCDDGNACTENDYCKNAKCEPGTPITCDNKQFCDGIETCDPLVGCVPGTPPDCDDGIPCTDDWCNSLANDGKGACEHYWAENAIEGPKGSQNCNDGIDNDCSGKKDLDDPACSFSVVRVEPDEGPAVGGSKVEIVGESFDLVSASTGFVIFGDVEVPFEVISPTRISVTTPPHPVGDVAVTVSTGKILYTKNNVFRYTGLAADENVNAIMLDPLQWEMDEGYTTKPYTVQVYIQGITDVIDPPPDPSLVLAQIGWGLKGTKPWEDPSWQWVNIGDPVDTTGGAFTYVKALTIEVGGRFNVACRFSLDGGYTFTFGDQDGSLNGYDPAMAAELTVWGVPVPGAIVINEIMWMGTKYSTYDEWIELRNMRPAPYRLYGYKITNAGNNKSDFVFQDVRHTINNLVIEPFGYFLIAEFDEANSALAIEPDIVGNNTMQLFDLPTFTYELVTGNGLVMDKATFTGKHGAADVAKPFRSMERKATPGDGTKDTSWQTAWVHTGFDGEPKQTQNYGTPRAPNSDIPLCFKDEDCIDEFPNVVVDQCERKGCGEFARCTILPIADGEPCDDGKFCTVDETCTSGVCGGGKPRDCSDDSPCTIDTCDENAKKCRNVPDPTAIEGPATSESCNDGVDNDCDGLTDSDDPQCSLIVTGLEPSVVPLNGGWEVMIKGSGFKSGDEDLVTGVFIKDLPAVLFVVLDSNTISAFVPAMQKPGDYDVSVSDGIVTATLEKGIRYIGHDETIWGNTQSPEKEIFIKLGQETPLIHGRVFADGITNAEQPDPTLVIAEIGIGPGIEPGFPYPHPYADPGWTWYPATYNPDCWLGECGGVKFEFLAKLKPEELGTFLVVFRYSVDGGMSFQYGDLTITDPNDPSIIISDGSADGWSAATSLAVVVEESNVPADHTEELGGIYHAPGKGDPLANCTSCHGADLKGDTGPSCYMCHNSADHQLNPNDSGVMHKEGDATSCNACHGPNNGGGMGPACSTCHI